ncbi:MAG: hypothetical protein RL459_294 [Pseudomonadota bacterium]|jgi:secreted PhoX family phosphatase
MTQAFQASRRKALQLFAGVPLLPLSASLGSAGLLSACGGGSDPVSTATITGVTFNNMAAPASVADRATTFTNATISVAYSDGTSKTQNLAYNAIYKTGDEFTRPDGGAVIAGGYYYPDGTTPILDISGTTAEQFYSDCPDGTSLLKLQNPSVAGISGNTVFAVTQFEYKNVDNAGNSMYGKLPSPIGIATLDQNKTTGALSVKHYYNVPTQDVHGLWITCAASLSPWNTHLSSEEYEPDAWKLDPVNIAANSADSGVIQFKAFSQNTFGSETAAKPYHYGHVPEVTVNPDGTGSIKKHYCMVRISRELVEVMPDNRTVLMGDDASGGGVFMFVADIAGELSSGTLYVAQVASTSTLNGGAFNLTWIELGHANSVEIEAMANTLTAADIMDVKTVDDVAYSKINFGNGYQWVKFVAGKEKAAAFLETRRYAAKMGGTMEFSKFEGVTVNAKDKLAYFAVAEIRDTMKVNVGAATDSIGLPENKAGAVYQVVLGTDATIGSDWVPKSMSVPSALLGETMTADAESNTSVVDKISNPDNVKFSEAMRTLFIGEDSGRHLNNFVWAYNVDTLKLSRILSAPAGGECVCLQAVDDLNGFAYVMSGFQHPGDWTFASVTNPALAGLEAAVKANWGDKKKAAVGYISGIPTLS